MLLKIYTFFSFLVKIEILLFPCGEFFCPIVLRAHFSFLRRIERTLILLHRRLHHQRRYFVFVLLAGGVAACVDFWWVVFNASAMDRYKDNDKFFVFMK